VVISLVIPHVDDVSRRRLHDLSNGQVLKVSILEAFFLCALLSIIGLLQTHALSAACTAPDSVATMSSAAPASRLPTFFLSHGGGPCFFMTSDGGPFQHMDKNSKAAAWYRDFARREGLADGDRKPRALLIVSAHWEASPVRVMTSARPSLLFDYHGFPKHTYELEYPCAGAPDVAARVRSLLTGAGIASADDAKRGLDHGVCVLITSMLQTGCLFNHQYVD
jgi:hypothetical protein